MNLDEMNRMVQKELVNIPRGNDAQHMLRFLYNMTRRRDLRRGKPMEESLAYCISRVKEDYPNWQPIFR